MKKLLFLTALLLSMLCHGQKFKFKSNGDTEFLVNNVDSISASKLYSRTLKWIEKNYNDPSTAIKGKTPNKQIRLYGRLPSAFTITLDTGEIEYDVTYSLEIHFKNNKYRVKYFHHSIVIDGERPMFKLTDVLNETPDKDNKHWVNHKRQYEARVQKLLNSLHQYITRK